MQIKNKRFPIRLEPKQAAEIIKKDLKKKGYKVDVNHKDLYLTLTPYWVCFYNILFNKNSTFEHFSGQIAINGVSNKINERVIELFNFEKPIVIEELDVPKTEKTQIVFKKTIISKKEAEKTINKYLASKHNVNLEDISLSGIEEITVPNWKFKLIDKKYNLNTKIKIDAIKGKVNDLDKIKNKVLSNKELFYEMIEDIKEPRKISNYFLKIFSTIGNSIIWIFKEIIKNYKVFLWILLIALFIYLLLL